MLGICQESSIQKIRDLLNSRLLSNQILGMQLIDALKLDFYQIVKFKTKNNIILFDEQFFNLKPTPYILYRLAHFIASRISKHKRIRKFGSRLYFLFVNLNMIRDKIDCSLIPIKIIFFEEYYILQLHFQYNNLQDICEQIDLVNPLPKHELGIIIDKKDSKSEQAKRHWAVPRSFSIHPIEYKLKNKQKLDYLEIDISVDYILKTW